MNLLSLPLDLIEDKIIPCLGWNDLLSLRRACILTWQMTTAFMRQHPELAPELEINEEDKSWKAFLEMDIPTTKLFINNRSGFQFLEVDSSQRPRCWTKRDAWRVVNMHGLLIKHLRLWELSMYVFGKERTFVEAFSNLETLEVGHLGNGTGTLFPEEPEQQKRAFNVQYQLALKDTRFREGFAPWSFYNLKHLIIGQQGNRLIPGMVSSMYNYTLECPQLQFLSLPFNIEVSTHNMELAELVNANRNRNLLLGIAFMFLEWAVRRGNLKEIDLANYNLTNYFGIEDHIRWRIEVLASAQFLELCVACQEKNVKLKNVNPTWLIHRHNYPNLDEEWRNPLLQNVILSLVDVTPEVLRLQLNNLTSIKVPGNSLTLAPNQARPLWPSLKKLDIFVDSKLGLADAEETTCFGLGMTASEIRTKYLFNFFFKNVVRPALMELRLEFGGDRESVAVPKTEDIVKACPNLKRLAIVNWPGTNQALAKLWKGLPELEELTLESCKKLGDAAFFGKSGRKPWFLKLKKLRKLSLKNLDQMPKITDVLFTRVLCHMPLTHFTITSSVTLNWRLDKCHAPIKSVTIGGLKCLLTGQFAAHIEHFPFSGWCLATVPLHEFQLFEQRFRSFQRV